MTEILLFGAIAFAALATCVAVFSFWVRPERYERLAALLLGGSLILLAGGLVARGAALHRFPMTGLYEFCLAFVLVVGIAFFCVRGIIRAPVFTVTIALTCFLGLALSVSLPHSDAPLMPALKSPWLTAHVLTAVVAYGAFAVSAVFAALYVFGRTQTSLPGQAVLDDISYKAVVLGFVFQTLLLITRAIWAEEVWGSWWSWDPKETWALITWLVYAAYLHGYKSRGWAGRKAAVFSLVGFCLVLFTLFGVSFFLPGLHSYF